MCDYCDCRSQPEIAELSEEHQRLLALTAAARRAVDESADGTLRELLDEMAAILVTHTAREEHGLFAVLRRIEVGDDYVGRFEHDHTHIDELLAAARDGRGDVVELVRELEEHILREETDTYPAAHQLLAPADWEAIDAATAHV